MSMRNDMQRVNRLRVEAETQRKNEELEAQHGPKEDFDNGPRPSRVSSILSIIRRISRPTP